MGDWMYAQRACDASVKLATVSVEGDEINVYLSDADAQDLADYLLAVLADRKKEAELEQKDGPACSNETSKTDLYATPTLSDIFVLNSVLTALTAFQTELSSLLKVCSSSNSNGPEEFCDHSSESGKRS
jgi:hypothetical protein